MLSKRAKKIFSLCLIVSVLLCGCSENSSNQSSIDDTKENWNNEELESGVVADLKLNYKENQKYSYKIINKNLSVKKIKTTLFPNDESKETYTKEPDGDSDYETLTTKNGLEIIGLSEGVLAETDEYRSINNVLLQDNGYAEHPGDYYKYMGSDEELPNLKQDEVKELCLEQIKELGIQLDVEQIYIRSFSSDYLNQLMKKAKEEVKKDKDSPYFNSEYIKEWKENEGIYFLYVEFSLDDTTLNASYSDDRIDSMGVNADEYYAKFWYNAQGCIGAEFEYFEITEKKETETIAGAYAVEAVKNDITSVIITDNDRYEMMEAVLCYTVVSGESGNYNERTIKPVWVINVNYESGSEDFNAIYTYFVDAVTGEVMKSC